MFHAADLFDLEPDEEDPDVVRRAFADQEGIAHAAAGLVNQEGDLWSSLPRKVLYRSC